MKKAPSIAAQCLAAVLITVISVLGVSSVVELNILKQREMRLLQERGELAAGRIADALSNALSSLNLKETERVVLDEIRSIDVARIRVFDGTGALYLGRVKGADGAISPIDANNPNSNTGPPAQYTFSKDINHGGKIGSVLLDVTDAHLQSELGKLQLGIAIKLMLLIALLSVVLLVALRRLVVEPLSALTSWTERLPAEKAPIPLKFKNSGEINSLAEAFGRMSLSLKKKNEELTNEQTRLQELNRKMQVETVERKRVEEAVKTNEALLRLFIRHTPAAIAMFDTEMRYLQVSDRFLTDYQLEGQDIIGRCHYEVFPDLPERWKEAHRRILAGAVERCEEEPYVAPDGNNGWLQWESLPWRRGNGEIGGLILFTQVITSRKQAEEALRRSEERFAKIFNLSPFRMGILRVRDGVVLEVNDSWIRDTGFSREEVINRSIFSLTPWMGDGLSEKVREVLSAQQPVRNLEVRFTSKDGHESISNTSVVPVDFENERCYLWAANDITERKHAEEALKASESRFSIAFNSNPMLATISVLEGGRFLAVNDSFVALTGYSRDEAVGHTALDLDLWPNPKDRIKVMEKLKRETSVRDFEARIRLKTGEERMLLLSVEKIELDGQVCLLHVGNDVTLRKRAEESLRALSAKLRSAREEEGTRIAREIHDELGGALTGLKWDLERIDRTLETGNGVRLPEVRKRIGTMTTLIETSINTVQRIASELRPGVLDDLGLVAAIEWQVQQFQSRTGLQCHWDNQVGDVEVDLNREKATAVFRILQEILTNVLRHARAKNLYVTLRNTDECLELEVRDDGQGITESQMINSRSLGLLGMKERALLVGGEVNITGEEGVGTTVVVRVPLET